ncbi:class I SAM-dependent methyltransferase [Streptacidiphilus monticola]
MAIAALLAGAAEVTVSEIDPLAQAAIRLNAEANGVGLGPSLGDVLDADPLPDAEVLLVGDAFYERPLADRVLAFARRMRSAGTDVLVGDPGRAYLPRTDLTEVAVYDVPVSRELENTDVRRTTVWRLPT